LQPFQHAQRVDAARVVQHQCKFVATKARDGICTANMQAQCFREMNQCGVAHRVTMLIVNQLETVQVHHHATHSRAHWL